jgi:hypothetical protein
MIDPVFKNFLETQHREASALAAVSDILQLDTEPANPPQKYVARFKCRGLVRTVRGAIEEATQFDVGIWLPDNYLRAADAKQVVTLLRPWSIWHPNINGPFICPGHLTGGTALVDILFQVYEIITYQKWAAHDGMNPAACEWARNNQERFPVDRRPLKRKEVKP